MTKIIKAKYKASRRLGKTVWGDAKDPFNTKNELTDLSWENNLTGSSSGVRKYYYNNEKWDTTKVIKYNESKLIL